MSVFTIQAPDGRKIKIEAGDQETAIRGAQEWVAANPAGTQPDAFANASRMSQSLQGGPGPRQEQRPTLGEEAMSFGRGVIEGIPIVGPALSDARRGLDANIMAALHGGEAHTYQDQLKGQDEALRSRTGGARTVGNVTGAVASLAPLGATALGGRLLGMTGSLPSRIALGGASGAAISGADTAARGGDMGDVLTSGGIGAALGSAIPVVGQGIRSALHSGAQRAATNAAIKGAPQAADLKSAASQMFQQLDQSGVMVSGARLQTMATDLLQKFTKMRANPKLDPKAVAALEQVVLAIDDAQKAGTGLALSDLHTLRQIAQKAAQSSEGRDQMFATQIINGIDDMIKGLKPADMIGGADPSQTSKLLFDALGTWSRASKVGILEEAIYKAQNQASGLENGLRIQFRQLLQNKSTRKLFNEAELQAISEVANGTALSNVMRLLGKFGFGTGSASNMLGGTIGFGAGSMSPLGPLGGILAAGVGTAARKGSEVLTNRAANRAAQVVATPNVPVLPRTNPPALLPPAGIPAAINQQRQPIEITVPYR